MPPDRTPADLLTPFEWASMRLGLERMREALERLGRPDRACPVVLVAGTNGKGTVAVTLDGIVGAAGYRTGLYTSPHLEAVRERVRIDGVAVGEAELVVDLELVLEHVGDLELTYFEVVTAAALVAFRRRRVDLAVLEVGLGGRLDATNATEPLLGVVTSLGLEHTAELGATIEEIAHEKAGIARPGVPLCHLERGGGVEALVARAAAIGAVLDPVPVPRASAGESSLAVEWRGRSLTLPGIGSIRHRRENVRLAVAAAARLVDLGFPAVDEVAVVAGAVRSRWPGRHETVVVPGRRLLLDGAHNPAGIEALVDSLDGPFEVLFGCFGDKAAREMLGPLRARASRVVLAGFDHPRAADPERLRAELAPDLEVASDPAAGVDRLVTGGPAERLGVVTGSLAFVGAVRAELRRRFGVPPPAAEISLRSGPAGPPGVDPQAEAGTRLG